jgi:tetratricopeptide (TPR) repeat protein
MIERLALVAVLLASFATIATAQVVPDEAHRRAAVERFWAGQELLQAERWERAATEFRAAIGLNPLLTDAHYGLGESQMGLRRYTSAALAFQACLEAARRVHTLREKARVETDRQIWEEVDQVRDTIRRRRDSGLRSRQLDQYVSTLLRSRSSLGLPFEPPAPVLLALGSAHFRNGDRGRAEYYWREATRVDDEFGEAWNNLAAVYAATSRRIEAQDALTRAEQAGYRVNPRLKEEIAALK